MKAFSARRHNGGSSPDRTRTCGLGIRNPALYPPELRGRALALRSRSRLYSIAGHSVPTISLGRRRTEFFTSMLANGAFL